MRCPRPLHPSIPKAFLSFLLVCCVVLQPVAGATVARRLQQKGNEDFHQKNSTATSNGNHSAAFDNVDPEWDLLLPPARHNRELVVLEDLVEEEERDDDSSSGVRGNPLAQQYHHRQQLLSATMQHNHSRHFHDHRRHYRGLAARGLIKLTLPKYRLPDFPTVMQIRKYAETVCGDFGLECIKDIVFDEDNYVDDGTVVTFSNQEKAQLRKILPFFKGRYGSNSRTNCCFVDCNGRSTAYNGYTCDRCSREQCQNLDTQEPGICNLVGELGVLLYTEGRSALFQKANDLNVQPMFLPEPFKDQIKCHFPSNQQGFLDDVVVFWGVPPLRTRDVNNVKQLQSSKIFGSVTGSTRVFSGFPSSGNVAMAPMLVTDSPATTYGTTIFMESPNLFDESSWSNEVLFQGRNRRQCGSSGAGQEYNRYWQMELLKQQVALAYLFTTSGNGDIETFGRDYYKAMCQAGTYQGNEYERKAAEYKCKGSCTGTSSISIGCLRNGYGGHFLQHSQSSGGVYQGVKMDPSDCGRYRSTLWIMERANSNPWNYDGYYLKVWPGNDPHQFVQRGLAGSHGLQYRNSLTGWIPDAEALEHLLFLVVPYGDSSAEISQRKFCLLNLGQMAYLGADHTTESGSYIHFIDVPSSGLTDRSNCQPWESFSFYSLSGTGPNIQPPACTNLGGSCLTGGAASNAAGESPRPLAGPADNKDLPDNGYTWGGFAHLYEDCVMTNRPESTPCCDGYRITLRDYVSGMCTQADSIRLDTCTDTYSGCAVPDEDKVETNDEGEGGLDNDNEEEGGNEEQPSSSSSTPKTNVFFAFVMAASMWFMIPP